MVRLDQEGQGRVHGSSPLSLLSELPLFLELRTRRQQK